MFIRAQSVRLTQQAPLIAADNRTLPFPQQHREHQSYLKHQYLKQLDPEHH